MVASPSFFVALPPFGTYSVSFCFFSHATYKTAFFFLFFPFFSFFFSKYFIEAERSKIFKADSMKTPKIYTYSPKNATTEFELYALSKGLNSGKPLETPCPNCFVISCRKSEELDQYRTLLFGLWKAKSFHQFFVGSVIPFIRINDFKNLVFEQMAHLQEKQKAYQQDVKKFKALEQNERAMYEQLLLISELKRIYISRHLKR